jgi:hypothetical protein
VASLLACNQPVMGPPSVAPQPAAAHETLQSHLLLYPEADAASLLGRAVQGSGDGSVSIADARAPGCEVVVRREAAEFHTERSVEAHAMAAIAAGYAKVISLDAKFGHSNKAEVDVQNTAILRADMRGACGERVVDTVFVGRGSRRLAAEAARSASAGVNVGPAQLAPSVDSGTKIVDALEWTTDQAYGFTYKTSTTSAPLDVRVALPSIVGEGDSVEVRFESNQPAWLVVYYLDAEGNGDVLWPSNEEPEPRVATGSAAVLPSAAERAQGIAIKAAVAHPGQRSRETLVVYGFAEKGDFDAMKPGRGAHSSDGAAFASELTRKLQTVPISRWSRSIVGYTIEPKGSR